MSIIFSRSVTLMNARGRAGLRFFNRRAVKPTRLLTSQDTALLCTVMLRPASRVILGITEGKATRVLSSKAAKTVRDFPVRRTVRCRVKR